MSCVLCPVFVSPIPRSLFTDSLNHFKLMFTNPHDEEFTEENLDEKTARDNLVMEVGTDSHLLCHINSSLFFSDLFRCAAILCGLYVSPVWLFVCQRNINRFRTIFIAPALQVCLVCSWALVALWVVVLLLQLRLNAMEGPWRGLEGARGNTGGARGSTGGIKGELGLKKEEGNPPTKNYLLLHGDQRSEVTRETEEL